MQFTTARTLSGASTTPHRGNRPVHVLSSGAVVALHKQGSTIAAQYSANRSAWTQKFTFTPTNWHINGDWAAALDESDNLHLIWLASTNGVRYVKFTYNSGTQTWTAGSVENITTSGGFQGSLALECMSGGALIAAWISVTEIFATRHLMYCRTTGGSWVQFASEGIIGAWQSTEGGLSIARDAAGAVSNVQTFAYWWRPGIGLPQGVGTMSVNLATGVRTAWKVIDGNAIDRGATDAEGDLYSYAPGRWRFVGYFKRFFYPEKWAFEIDATKYILRPVRKIMTFASMAATGYMADRGVIYYKPTTTRHVYASYVIFTPTAILFTAVDELIEVASPTAPSWLGGGANRNFAQSRMDLIAARGTTNIIHTYAVPPTMVPNRIKPDNTAVVTDSYPFVEASNILDRGMRQRVQWEIAPDNTFSAGVLAGVEPVESHLVDPPRASWSAYNGTTSVRFGSRVPSGTKWIRARLINYAGLAGPASAAQQFTIFHPPSSTGQAPRDAVMRGWGDAGEIMTTWQFTSTSWEDSQTAYQIVVEVNEDGTPVLDTGKVASTVESATITIPESFKDILLRWKIRVWDLDDTAGEYSDYFTFSVGDSPTVTITVPGEGESIDNPAPTVTWEVELPGTRTVDRWTVDFIDAITQELVHTHTETTADLTHTPSQAVLSNDRDYYITVTILDSEGLTDSDTHLVSAEWEPPGPFAAALDASTYESLGYIRIHWLTEALDDTYVATRVYRRELGEVTRTLMYEVHDPTVLEYHDWLALPTKTYHYQVVQVAERFGVYLESDGQWLGPVTPQSSDFWLLHPDGIEELHVRLHHVTGDSFTDEWEETTLTLIGRGRKKDYGTHWGVSGSLTATIRNDWHRNRTASQQIDELNTSKPGVRLLRNPFGRLWSVSIGSISYDRTPGVGPMEYATATIPYEEVH